LVDFIRHNSWFKQNLFICLITSFGYFGVYWYYQYDPILLPASIFLVLTVLSLVLYFSQKDELSFYLIYFNFFLVLPIFSYIIDVNFTIIGTYIVLLVNAFIMVVDNKALIIVSGLSLLSFGAFVLVNIFFVGDDILVLRTFDLILAFVVVLSLVNTLLQFNAEKRQQIQELDNKNEELEKYIESNLELENFAFIASHDLKTPIRNIMGFSQLLKSKSSDRLKANESEYLDLIINSTKHMNQLVTDILKYSKSDTLDYQSEQINLSSLMSLVIKDLAAIIDEKSATLHMDIQKDQVIYGDSSMLQSVFRNLLINSLNYVTEGIKPKITLASNIVREETVISVIDNGIGISPEYRETVFLLFKRLHSQMSYAGTGIGLSIAKKVINKHGGRIWIESNPSGGSIFKVVLPRLGKSKKGNF